MLLYTISHAKISLISCEKYILTDPSPQKGLRMDYSKLDLIAEECVLRIDVAENAINTAIGGADFRARSRNHVLHRRLFDLVVANLTKL